MGQLFSYTVNSTFPLFSALVIATGFATWVFSLIISHAVRLIIDEEGEASWILRFIFTILGYATVFLPCYVLIHLSRRHNLHTLGKYKKQTEYEILSN